MFYMIEVFAQNISNQKYLRNKHTGKRPKEKKYINNINNNKIHISLLSPGYLTFPFTCVYSFSYPSLFSILDLGFVLLLQLYRSVSPSVPHFSLSLLFLFPLFCLSLCLSLVSFLSLYPFYQHPEFSVQELDKKTVFHQLFLLIIPTKNVVIFEYHFSVCTS